MPKTDEIYSRKTKEYFDEILSSYSNGNYRSAIVMLYSVTIFDLLNKLKELADMYDDEKSKKILDEITKSRFDNKRSKSSWEKELVDSLYNKTCFLNLEQYTQLNHLYDYRNFCAHPALNEDYELITPSKEITIAHIKNILESILIKSPIFIDDIFDSLTEELEFRAEEFEGLSEYKYLKSFLVNKYFSRMNDNMTKKIFKRLWKITFISKDERCNKNRRINRKAIDVLYGYKKDMLEKTIKEESFYNSTDLVNAKAIREMIYFLSSFSNLYGILSNDIKHKIEKLIGDNNDLKIIAWFTKESKEDHLKYLYKEKDLCCEVFDGSLSYLVSIYKNEGIEKELLDFLIEIFSKVKSFFYADFVYDNYIKSHLENFSEEQAIRLIESINNNVQINKRNKSEYANNEIVSILKKKLGFDFDYTKYKDFCFDKNVLKET